ncbi:MAG TPA: hypothetical protein VF945_09010, partial [Polyangia bacterium]
VAAVAQGLLVAGTLATTPAAHRLSFWLPAVLVFGVVVLVCTRSIVRQARRAATYQLTIGPNVLRIVQQGLTPTEVFRHDVRRIVEFPAGLRIVYGSGRFAGVPRYLDGYDAARARLAAWHAIERGSATVGRILLVTPMLGVVVGGLPLPATALTAVNAAWAASLALFMWRVSRTALSKKQRAGSYVSFGALLVWALWRLWAVWR